MALKSPSSIVRSPRRNNNLELSLDRRRAILHLRISILPRAVNRDEMTHSLAKTRKTVVQSVLYLTLVPLLAAPFGIRVAANRNIDRAVDDNASLAFLNDQTESVREELIRLQHDTGLSFAWDIEGVHVLSFKKGKAFENEALLSVFRPDTFSYQKYPAVAAIDNCWSHDQSKLVATMIDLSAGSALGIVDLKSGQTLVVSPRVGQSPHVTSQCWSPDDRRIVYEVEGLISVYDVETRESSVLIQRNDPKWSGDPTWAPHNKSIAFLDYDAYYSISPTGGAKTRLFGDKGACSGLYWSPDSRIVAYVGIATVLEGGITLDAEGLRLRARRLSDGSRTSFAVNVDCVANFKWITNKQLAAQVEAASK